MNQNGGIQYVPPFNIYIGFNPSYVMIELLNKQEAYTARKAFPYFFDTLSTNLLHVYYIHPDIGETVYEFINAAAGI